MMTLVDNDMAIIRNEVLYYTFSVETLDYANVDDPRPFVLPASKLP